MPKLLVPKTIANPNKMPKKLLTFIILPPL